MKLDDTKYNVYKNHILITTIKAEEKYLEHCF